MNLQKFLFWAPRGLTIFFILFISIFALDVFGLGQPIPYMIVAFLIHLIPSFILLAVFLITWKYELFGFVFIVLGILYMIVSFKNVGVLALSWSIVISGPAFLIGGLFILDYLFSRKIEKLR